MSTESVQPHQPAAEVNPGPHPMREQSMQERWEDFAKSVSVKAEKPAEQKPAEQKHVDLSKASEKELSEWNKTGELPQHKDDKAGAGRNVEEETARAAANDSEDAPPAPPSDPAELQAWHDRNFDGMTKSVSADAELSKGLQNFHIQPDRGNIILHTLADYPKSVQKMVLKELASDPRLQHIVREGPAFADPRQLVRAVHAMVKEIPKELAARKAAEPKPRAPKPPAEVGGRGTVPEDASVHAAREGNFAGFEAAEWAKRRRG